MKTSNEIKIDGMTVKIPTWARWLAQDATGRWDVYSRKPEIDTECGLWGGDFSSLEHHPKRYATVLIDGTPPKDFTQELYQLYWKYEYE